MINCERYSARISQQACEAYEQADKYNCIKCQHSAGYKNKRKAPTLGRARIRQTIAEVGFKNGDRVIISPQIKRKLSGGNMKAYIFVRCKCGDESWVYKSKFMKGGLKRCAACAVEHMRGQKKTKKSFD